MKKKKIYFPSLLPRQSFRAAAKGEGTQAGPRVLPELRSWTLEYKEAGGGWGWSLHGWNPDSKKVSRERTPDTYTESPTSIHTAKDCSRHPREETLRGWAKNPPLFPHWKLEGRLWSISQRQETVLTLNNQNLKSQTWWGHWLEY